ncbi:BON domain-containing protein [Flagellimonas meridianipacifica]|uniref:Osmotically-inducible protein OsmY n=1 Tax=Flagellimonas meridianipacifica TaxID=1080225 RepID=A0A2T0MB16_9FLAO|nr:BON domain-containing protein [Allomuricauda pacifica]PRX54655.1 osmotically-inducible protein OsmY [Allomuricauda pacifica]
MKTDVKILKSDAEIKEDVLEELLWQPDIDETQIGVIVEDGVVTLTGVVDSYVKKSAAEKAIKGIAGVRAVADDIEIKYGNEYKRTDKEIAKAVANAMEWNPSIPEDNLNVTVREGWVFVSGEVNWGYQRNATKKTLEKLLGVRGVNVNQITIKQRVKPLDVQNKIINAFERAADIEAKGITVEVEGSTVTLRGKVHSIKEKEDAEKAAYKAPGVISVVNKLKVQFYPVKNA